MRLKQLALFIMLPLIVFSCKTKNDITYMQDIDQMAIEASKKNAHLNIGVGDQLKIEVSGIDADVVAPFNQNYSSRRSARYGESLSNVPNTGQMEIAPTYIVDAEGNINFPVIGRIEVLNKTLSEVEADLENRISKYVKNPIVNVNLGNFKITVLGEVSRPGQYLVPDGQATVLNALGMAGDVTIYGVRTNVLLVRNTDGNISEHRIDITKADFINSPYYHLKQNDVIYVSPNKTEINSSNYGRQTSIYISIASILVTIIALIVRK